MRPLLVLLAACAAGCAAVPASAPAPAVPPPAPAAPPPELALAAPSASGIPPEFRLRGVPRRGPGLEGARYLRRFDRSDGNFTMAFYEVRGDAVYYSIYANYPSAGIRSTKELELRDGRFFMKADPNWCRAIVSTGDCGLQGTVSEDAIRFVRLENGTPSGNQNNYESESVLPVPRQK